MRFLDFRDGPGGYICIRLGYDIGTCKTWHEYIYQSRLYNEHGPGFLVDSARELYGVLSTGERAVLLAALAAADFGWLADELADGRTWRILDYVTGDHAAAVAACIVRHD